MRIYTWLHYDLKSGGAILHSETYEGPLAYAKGETTVENETVPTGPFGPQIPFILSLFNEAARLYQQGPPQAFPGVDAEGNVAPGGQLTPDINQNIQGTYDAAPVLAGGNIGQNTGIQQFLQQYAQSQNPGAQLGGELAPFILQGLQSQIGAQSNPLTQITGGQAGNVGQAYQSIFGQQPQEVGAPTTQGGQANVAPALGQLLQGGGGTNPFLESLVQGAIQGQVNNFQRNIIPGIRTEAQGAGQVGGTRQGVAEGIAAGDLLNQERLLRENIYGNAFGQQAGLQGQAVSDVLRAQAGDQGAALQAAGLSNQAYQNYISNLLQGTSQVQQGLGAGLGLGYNAVGTGTAQAGNLFGQGNSLQLQQTLQGLGLIPGFQAGSLGQLGALNQLGLQQYGLGQNQIDALANQYYFNQNSPYNLLSQFQQYISGPYGSSVGNYQGSPYSNIFPGYGQYNVQPFSPPQQQPSQGQAFPTQPTPLQL